MRETTAADLAVIMRIEREAFSVPWSEESLFAEIRGNHQSRSYVAIVDGCVAAYVIWWRFAGEGHIGRIVVDKDFQRRGIGSALLATALRRMRRDEIREAFLEVRSSNEAAIDMYLKSGFQRFGVRKNYYFREQEDAILMRLTLKEGKNELV